MQHRMHVFFFCLCSSSVNKWLKIGCLPLCIDDLCLSKYKLPAFGSCSLAALSRDAVNAQCNSCREVLSLLKQNGDT